MRVHTWKKCNGTKLSLQVLEDLFCRPKNTAEGFAVSEQLGYGRSTGELSRAV